MSPTEVDRLATAEGIARAVRSGAVRPSTVLAEFRARAEASAGLNAIVAPRWDRAAEEAAALDELSTEELARLPLAGVPMTVKDVLSVTGMPTTAGVDVWPGLPAASDAAAVASVRAAGAVVVGKTNLPPFAFGTVTGNRRFGTTLNPLASGRSPGGSSGGESAAIAAGMSAAGLGTDYGGSLRWPAQCTGIVALRPTVGRVPTTGQVPGLGGALGDAGPALPNAALLQGRLQVVGPLAPAVEDLRLLLGVIARPDGLDDRVRPLAVPARAATDRLLIGWSTGERIGRVRRETADLVRRVAEELVPLSASVVEISDLFADCYPAYRRLREQEINVDHWSALKRMSIDPALAALLGPKQRDDSAHAAARLAADAAAEEAMSVFERVDVVLLPVAPGPACGLDDRLDVDGRTVAGGDLMAHCRAVSLLGVPVVSVPVGLSAEGLPLSLQVVAAPWKEHLALDVAAQIEWILAGE